MVIIVINFDKFPLVFNGLLTILLNINKYANEIICKLFHQIKGQRFSSTDVLVSFFYHEN